MQPVREDIFFLERLTQLESGGEGHVPLSWNQDLQELARLASGRGQEEHNPREQVRDCAKSCPLWVGTKEGSSVQLLTWADKLSLEMVPAVGELGELSMTTGQTSQAPRGNTAGKEVM